MSDEDRALEAFLDLLKRDIDKGNVVTNLPAAVCAFIESHDLSFVDVDEKIEGEVEL